MYAPFFFSKNEVNENVKKTRLIRSIEFHDNSKLLRSPFTFITLSKKRKRRENRTIEELARSRSIINVLYLPYIPSLAIEGRTHGNVRLLFKDCLLVTL